MNKSPAVATRPLTHRDAESASLDDLARCFVELLRILQENNNVTFVVAKEITSELFFKCVYVGLLIKKLNPSLKIRLLDKLERDEKSGGLTLKDWNTFLSKTIPEKTKTRLTSLSRIKRDDVPNTLLNQRMHHRGLINVISGAMSLDGITSSSFGFLYEKLSFGLSERDLGKNEFDLSTTIRKIFGTFYTPAHIAEFITKNALNSHSVSRKSSQFRVFDPAVGSGIFLIHSLRYLVAKFSFEARQKKTPTSFNFLYRKACKSLFGNDIDPISAEITKMALSIESNFSPIDDILNKQVFSYDALLQDEQWKRMDFDVILMNPPYGRVKDSVKRIAYASHYAGYISGEMNLYKLFIALAVRTLKEGSSIGIICPSDFLRESSSTDLRKKLMSEFEHQYMFDLPLNFFPNVSLEPFIGIMRKKKPQIDFFDNARINWFSDKNRKNLSFEEIMSSVVERSLPDLIDPFDYSINSGSRKRKVNRNLKMVPLNSIFDVNFGFHPGSNKSFSKLKRNSNDRLAIEGRDIDCFQTSREQKYIAVGDDAYSKYREIKIVMQRVRTRKLGQGSKWMRAVLDTKGCVNMASTNGLYLKNDLYDPFALVAILNSNWIEDELKAICTNVNITASTLYKMDMPIPRDSNDMRMLSRIGKRLTIEGVGTKGDAEKKLKIKKLLDEVNEVLK